MTATHRDPRDTLARIRAQADAATDGPWEVRHYHFADGEWMESSVVPSEHGDFYEDDGSCIQVNSMEADAEFITAARTDVPWLMEEVERRDKALDAVLKLHKPIQATTTNSNGGVSDVTVCDHCLDPTWPCPTVTAITAALEGEYDD